MSKIGHVYSILAHNLCATGADPLNGTQSFAYTPVPQISALHLSPCTVFLHLGHMPILDNANALPSICVAEVSAGALRAALVEPAEHRGG